MRKLARSNVVEHTPATERHVEFVFDEGFQRQRQDAVRAVRACAGKWTVNVTKTPRASKGATPARGNSSRGSTPACGGGSSSCAPACGGDSSSSGGGRGSSAPASGGQIQEKKKQKSMSVSVSSLGDLWQLLQMLRRIRNSRDAPLIWREERVGM